MGVCTNKSERLRRRRQKVSVASRKEEVGSSYRTPGPSTSSSFPFLRPGFAPQITNCLATPLGVEVYLLALRISTLFMPHKGVGVGVGVGAGARAWVALALTLCHRRQRRSRWHLPETYGSTLKPKPLSQGLTEDTGRKCGKKTEIIRL